MVRSGWSCQVEASTSVRTYGQPASDHTADAEELAGLYAFGVLDGADLARFSRHLARCGRCAEVVDGDVAMVGAVAVTASEVDAASDLKSRLMARAAAEAATPPAAISRDDRPVRATRRATSMPLAWLLPLAAVLVALLAGTALLSRELLNSQVVASAPLQNSADRGRADVLVRRSGDAVIQLSGFEDLSGGRVYQAWVIRPGQAPIPTGVTTSGDGALTLDGDVRGATVAVTVEPRRGSTAPSQTPFAVGEAPA